MTVTLDRLVSVSLREVWARKIGLLCETQVPAAGEE
jgi:hypothetical protein